MDRVYEDDKTPVLIKIYGFRIIVLSKQNRKFHWFYDKKPYKKGNNIEHHFLK